MISIEPFTIFRDNHPALNVGATPSSTSTITGFSTVKYMVPETQPADRLLQLERLLGYNGGPACLLYEGE